MLITSRGGNRWVLPKGNRMKGLPPHAAAEQEAWEEAGVHGLICPTPLGDYSARKLLKTGEALPLNIRVYPLAVTEELTDWPEASQRNRRWFPIAEAVEAVEEDQLRTLMRNFREADFAPPASNGPASASELWQMLLGLRRAMQWRAMMPGQRGFFLMFEAHGQIVHSAAESLARLVQGGPDMATHIADIIEREDEADAITRDVLIDARRRWFPPFGKRATVRLISALDDVVDQMQGIANLIGIYEIASFAPEMRDMAAIILDSARLVAEALPLLRQIHIHADRLHALTERLVRMENQADGIHMQGLKKAYLALGAEQPMAYFITRELYRQLELVVDGFEDIANEIDGLVIDAA